MATKILCGDRALACDAEVHVNPKMWFEPGEVGWPCTYRKKPPQMAVLHWTGAENPVETFYKNCLSRQVSAHFFVTGDGTIHQLADIEDTICYHARSPKGVVNARSVGIEIQNAGLYWNKPLNTAAKKLARPTYVDTIKGKKLKMLMFNAPQVESVFQILACLARADIIKEQIPIANDGGILREPMTMAMLKTYRGVCGHYHVPDSVKYDPGTQLFQALRDEGWTA